MTERVRGKSNHGYRGKYFDIRVKLYTGETFPFRDTHNDMKLRDIKSKMEFVTGIPCHLQRLTYLDSGKDCTDTCVKLWKKLFILFIYLPVFIYLFIFSFYFLFIYLNLTKTTTQVQ